MLSLSPDTATPERSPEPETKPAAPVIAPPLESPADPWKSLLNSGLNRRDDAVGGNTEFLKQSVRRS